MDAYQITADLIKALGHPARLQILEALAEEGEACVCHLEWRLGLRQAYLSQHLARMREAGLVTDHRQGLNIFYALSSPDIIELLASLKQNSLSLSTTEASFELPEGDPERLCPCPRCNLDA
jgi:ArsR family transcriptional regulator